MTEGATVAISTAALVRDVEIWLAHRVDGYLAGDHLGLAPGVGSEPGDARPYVPGDDVRFVDWNVTARTGEPYVRAPIADRELETWLLADCSASLDFGTAGGTKRDVVLWAAAAVALLVLRPGNRLGALAFDSRVVARQPPRGGREHAIRAVETLAAARGASGSTDLDCSVRELERSATCAGLVVVVSDFLCSGDWAARLRALARRHDVVAIEIVDPRELDIPAAGVLSLRCTETGRTRHVQTNSRRIRDQFARAAREQRESIERSLRGAGVDHVVLRTDSDWRADLLRFLADRRHRHFHRPLPA